MRPIRWTLYGFALPAILPVLPLMSFGISEVGAYVKGTEFRTFMGEILIQLLSGIVDAILVGFATLWLG